MYNGWNGKVVLLSVVKQLEDVVTVDDAGLAAENVGGTHCGS